MSDLLPPNSTKQERALSETCGRMLNIPVPLRSLWDPETCPIEILPWLAWGLSVDEWDPAWPESQKRAVVQDSIIIHMHKGTIGAVRRALDVVVGGGEVEEWFRYGGSPGYFRVNITLANFGLGAETWDRLTRLIEAHKNVRSWLEQINIYLTAAGLRSMATAMMSGETVTVYPYAITELSNGAPVYWAIGCQAVETITVYPQTA